MKKSSYMTRAMKARDPRYARILSDLGYERTDAVADDGRQAKKPFDGKGDHDKNGKTGGAPKQKEDISALRKQYHDAVGKKPFGGWDAKTLEAKIAEATKA
ncbi:hypothetical protein FHR70_003737 [Microvirga lupini]|uniref:Uncharacterized protein n=1 Tax=Microvirga lupini TaxID=420324 RepID=A0A7W4VP52_9HYPH|nr:hypothetical protein [Microvirga lupini]MBB3020651.1 hypothetical protein [Microvirga lupini]